MTRRTDFVLLQCQPGDVSKALAAAKHVCEASRLDLSLVRIAWNKEIGILYAYFKLKVPIVIAYTAIEEVANLWILTGPSGDPSSLQASEAKPGRQANPVKLSRLELVQDLTGHSANELPNFHYVVETDPEDGWADEIFRWYDTEHMPGLAQVPGCIRARRLLNHDHDHDHDATRPYSFACYDLVSKETLGSAPWLAVRGTAWSDITRPHFTNTRRTMLDVLA